MVYDDRKLITSCICVQSLKTVCVIGPLSQSKTMAKKSLYNAL